MAQTTRLSRKFKPGDRVVQNLNQPHWPVEDHLSSLISTGTVASYRDEWPDPMIKWDNGAVSPAEESSLTLEPVSAVLEIFVDNSVELSSDLENASPGLRRLAQLEAEIESAKRQSQRAAFEIKEDQLWQEAGYESFPHYCKERWGWEKSNAYDMAIAGHTINHLLDSGVPEEAIPQSTSALAAIAQAPTQQQASVLQETQARDGKVTANGVKKTLRHTTSLALVKALWSQLGTVETGQLSNLEQFTVSGPLFDVPLTFESVKDAQQQWELDGQRLCAIAVRKYPPNPDSKKLLFDVPCRITTSGRSGDVGSRAFIMGDWSPDAEDPRGNKPTAWDYPFLPEGSPILRSLHLFQVKIDWEGTHNWKLPTHSAHVTISDLPVQEKPHPVPSLLSEQYSPDDRRGQEKSAIARNLPAMAPLPTGSYALIVADPPWKYTLRETDASHRGRTPYPTMSDEEILTLPIDQLAADNAYILLWATNAHLPLAFDCLACWGFEYKAIHTWVKQGGATGKTQIGLGHYGRNCTEHYLVGVRGNPGAWSSHGLTDIPTVIFEGRKEHSKKPTEFWTIAQALNAKLGGEAIELFARGDRAGWNTWGLEA